MRTCQNFRRTYLYSHVHMQLHTVYKTNYVRILTYYICNDNKITGSNSRHSTYSCQKFSTINSHKVTQIALTHNFVSIICVSCIEACFYSFLFVICYLHFKQGNIFYYMIF
jgi:hypothetical protein